MLDAGIAAYNQDANRYNNATQALDTLQSQGRPTDDAAGKAYDSKLAVALSEVDKTRAQVSKSAQAYSTLVAKRASWAESKARAAKDPNEQRLWAEQADEARNHSALYASEAAMYAAKTDSQIQSASTRAQAALQNASAKAARVGSQNDRDAAQAMLAREHAALLPALSQSTIALHNQQIATAASHAQLFAAQTARAQAQTEYLIPAQASYYVSRGILTQAQADQLARIGPVKVDELEARLGLNQARADLIRSQIGKQQVIPAADAHNPNLAIFQPSTGDVSRVPNPAYVNETLRSVQDTNNAINAIEQEIADHRLDPDEGSRLIDGLREALHYKQLGTTPFEYQKYQQEQNQQQGKFAQNLLGDIATRGAQTGQNAAEMFLNAASKARGLGGVNVTPFSSGLQMAQGMMGGPQVTGAAQNVLLQSLQAMQNMGPISSKFDALKAFATLSQAKRALEQSAGGEAPDQQSQQAMAQSVSPQANQQDQYDDSKSNGLPAGAM